MRRWAVKLVLVMVMVALSGLVRAETDIKGWGKTKWGMTESELVGIYAGKIQKSKVENPAIKMEMKGVKVLGYDFTVQFGFDQNGRLKETILFPGNDSISTQGLFSSLEKELTDKYGKPAYRDKKKSSLGLEFESGWRLSSTSIQLGFLDLGNASFIKIHYKSRKATDKNL